MQELLFRDPGVTLLRASDEREHGVKPEEFIMTPNIREESCNIVNILLARGGNFN